MEISMLAEVKVILKSLVLSCPQKITVEQLNRDYRDVEGQFIPFRQLGYDNLEQFLRSVPDTLQIFGNGPTALVCFVPNEKSDHIHDMVLKQKKSNSKSLSRPQSIGLNGSNAIYGGNFRGQRKVSGQQLSPYHNVTRNQMAKTLQVKPLPEAVQRPNRVSNQLYNSLPQSNSLNPNIYSIRKGLIIPIHNHEQKKINLLSSALEKQCSVINPPPPLHRAQERKVLFPSGHNTSTVQVEGNAQNEKLSNTKKSPETETRTSLIQIKPPAANNQISVKRVQEVSDMPKLTKSSAQIKEPGKSLCTQSPKVPAATQNVSSKQCKYFFDDSTDSVVDPDEAIPSFAAKNNVFRLDFPEHTVSYGNKIAPCELPSEITVGSCLKIFISEIHSPFKFWFHIHKENHELDLLMCQIEYYYSNLDSEDWRIPIMCLTPGQVCAACYNGLWHRAEIVAPPVNKSVKVFFMDYGTVTEVEIENIKFLARFFAQMPAQAIRGCLSHIKPCQYHWSHAATHHFLTLVAELMLYAKITEIDEKNNVLHMILCDTNGDEVVQINSSLVNNHYAVYNLDWKAQNIRQNNGKRLHHPREDFPTFSMIERGEYPSFYELVNLLQHGVDYETIYDIIIFNQRNVLNKDESASEGLKSLPYFLTTSNPFRYEVLLELHATASKAI